MHSTQLTLAIAHPFVSKPVESLALRSKVDSMTEEMLEQDVIQNIEAVCSYPTPTHLKHLRSFLGLASYYRRFIANFAKIANPLHALTRKDTPFLWDSTCQQAFESLKQCLIAAPVLAFPNIDDPFLMEMDASGIDLGAVLALKQEDGSVLLLAYASCYLQKNERNYGVTELEALAVVWGVKHFRPYLHGHCEVALATLLSYSSLAERSPQAPHKQG